MVRPYLPLGAVLLASAIGQERFSGADFYEQFNVPPDLLSAAQFEQKACPAVGNYSCVTIHNHVLHGTLLREGFLEGKLTLVHDKTGRAIEIERANGNIKSVSIGTMDDKFRADVEITAIDRAGLFCTANYARKSEQHGDGHYLCPDAFWAPTKAMRHYQFPPRIQQK